MEVVGDLSLRSDAADSVRGKLEQRRHRGVEPSASLHPFSNPRIQAVSGDRKQVRPKAVPLRKLVATFRAGEEHVVDQVIDILGELVPKEAVQRLEVAFHQRRPGFGIPLRPTSNHLRVVGH